VNTDVFTITNDVQTNIDNINKKPLDLNKLLDKRKNSFHEISELISEKTRSKSSETSNDTRSTSVNSELSFRLSD
jgi:hypothetical protein